MILRLLTTAFALAVALGASWWLAELTARAGEVL